MRRSQWHHGHSLLTGIVGGLMLAGRPLLLIGLGLALGLALAKLGAVVRWIGGRFAR